jgi:hypothetical protein
MFKAVRNENVLPYASTVYSKLVHMHARGVLKSPEATNIKHVAPRVFYEEREAGIM